MSHLPTTRWSLIEASGLGGTESKAAWESLIQRYRSVVLVYFRRQFDHDEAEDLTQQFLTQSIAANWWARADADRGSFRSFLYTLLQRFSRDAKARLVTPVATWAAEDPAAGPSPAREVDLAFITILTAQALAHLREEYAARGKLSVFEALRQELADPGAHGALQALALELGIKPNTLVIERRRLAERLRQRIRQELADLCRTTAQLDADWAALVAVLRIDSGQTDHGY